MNEADRQTRNLEKLAELYVTMRPKIAAVIADLESHEFRPRIQEAYRSPVAQLADYKAWHSKLMFGFHNVTGDGGRPESLAVDLLDDDHPTQESTRFLLMLASSAQSHGLTTGIRWGLSMVERSLIDAAIKTKKWDADLNVGWDPSHIQPNGMTAAQAKAGKRPS